MAQLELALTASGCDQAHVLHKPKLLSDNGPSYVAADLATIAACAICGVWHAWLVDLRSPDAHWAERAIRGSADVDVELAKTRGDVVHPGIRRPVVC